MQHEKWNMSQLVNPLRGIRLISTHFSTIPEPLRGIHSPASIISISPPLVMGHKVLVERMEFQIISLALRASAIVANDGVSDEYPLGVKESVIINE